VKSRIAILTCAVAGLGAAAVPTGASAATQPPDMCFESPQIAVCTSDVGPLAQQAAGDPVGTATWLAGVGTRLVCDSPAIDCSITS
jgi:hypothetical protein